MANKTLFSSIKSKLPRTDSYNEAGGRAYKFTPKHALAQMAANVPELPGPVVIGLDTSGSMGCPVTGFRGRGATTKMRCVDVAALFAAAILRRNPDSVVIPFDTRANNVRVDPGSSYHPGPPGSSLCGLPLPTVHVAKPPCK